MIKVGLIGLGKVARLSHIPKMKATNKFEIKAAADIYPDNGTAQQFGIPEYYTDYKKILQDPEIEAVIVMSPHDCHVEHCVAAFEAGKHVLIEKPIARNLQEAKKIMAAATVLTGTPVPSS